MPRGTNVLASAAGTILAVILGVTAGWMITSDARASIDPGADSSALYDSTAPGVTANVTETFCVRNESEFTSFDPAYWQSQIEGWLNDPGGWELIGTTKVDFVSSSCNSCDDVVFCIEFWGIDDPGFCGGQGAFGGCAGFRSGQISAIDGHNHFLRGKIHIPVDSVHNDWRCQAGTCTEAQDDDKIRVINHEMAHLLGEGGHSPEALAGPEFGVANDGGVWDGNFDYNPVHGEIDRVRAHLDGVPARPAANCVGFPEDDRIVVSWFDAARDETDNDVDLLRLPEPAEFEMNHAASAFGERVTLLSESRSDVTDPQGGLVIWVATAKVVGGPRGLTNSHAGPLTFAFSSGSGQPSRPCALNFDQTGPFGQVQLTWVDASYDETEFAVYYQYVAPYPGGSDGSQGLDPDGWWPQPGQPAILLSAGTTAYADSAQGHAFLEFDQGRVCAKVVALEFAASSFDSNYSCTQITSDWDGDGWADDLESSIGTNPLDPCAADSTANNEPLPDQWPPDFDDDQLVSIVDVLALKTPFNTTVPPTSPRFDLNADTVINIVDLLALKPWMNMNCNP